MYLDSTINELQGFLRNSRNVRKDATLVDETKQDLSSLTNYLDRLITSLLTNEERFKDHIANSMLEPIENQFHDAEKAEVLNITDREEQVQVVLSHLFDLPPTVCSSYNYRSTLSVNPKLASLVYGVLLEPIADTAMSIDSTDLPFDEVGIEADDEYGDGDEPGIYEASSGSQDYEEELSYGVARTALKSLIKIPNLSVDMAIDYHKREVIDDEYLVLLLKKVVTNDTALPSYITDNLERIFNDLYSKLYEKESFDGEHLDELKDLMTIFALSKQFETKASFRKKLGNLALNYPDHKINYFAFRALSKLFSSENESDGLVKSILEFVLDENNLTFNRLAAATSLISSGVPKESLDNLVEMLFHNEEFDIYAYAILAQQIFKKPELAQEITAKIWDKLGSLNADHEGYNNLPFIFLTQFDPASNKALELLDRGQEIFDTENSTLMMAYLYRFREKYLVSNPNLSDNFEQFLANMDEFKKMNSQAYIYEAAIAGIDHDGIAEAVIEDLKDTEETDIFDAALLALPALDDKFYDHLLEKYSSCSADDFESLLRIFNFRLGDIKTTMDQECDDRIMELEDNLDMMLSLSLSMAMTDKPGSALVNKYMKFLKVNYSNSLFDNPVEMENIMRSFSALHKDIMRPIIEETLSKPGASGVDADLYSRIYKVFDLSVANQHRLGN